MPEKDSFEIALFRYFSLYLLIWHICVAYSRDAFINIASNSVESGTKTEFSGHFHVSPSLDQTFNTPDAKAIDDVLCP